MALRYVREVAKAVVPTATACIGLTYYYIRSANKMQDYDGMYFEYDPSVGLGSDAALVKVATPSIMEHAGAAFSTVIENNIDVGTASSLKLMTDFTYPTKMEPLWMALFIAIALLTIVALGYFCKAISARVQAKAISTHVQAKAIDTWQRLPAPLRAYASRVWTWYTHYSVIIAADLIASLASKADTYGGTTSLNQLVLALFLALFPGNAPADHGPPHEPQPLPDQGGGGDDPDPPGDGPPPPSNHDPDLHPDGGSDAPSGDDTPTMPTSRSPPQLPDTGSNDTPQDNPESPIDDDNDQDEQWFDAPEQQPTSDTDEMHDDAGGATFTDPRIAPDGIPKSEVSLWRQVEMVDREVQTDVPEVVGVAETVCSGNGTATASTTACKSVQTDEEDASAFTEQMLVDEQDAHAKTMAKLKIEHDSFVDINSKLKKTSTALAATKSELEGVKNELVASKHRPFLERLQHNNTKDQLSELRHAYDQAEAELKTARPKLVELDELRLSSEELTEELSKLKVQHEADLQADAQTIADLRSRLQTSQRELKAAQKVEKDTGYFTREIQSLASSNKELGDENKELREAAKHDLRNAESRDARNQHTIDDLRQTALSSDEQSKELQDHLKASIEQVSKLQDDFNTSEKKREHLCSELANSEELLRSANDHWSQNRELYQETAKKLNELQSAFNEAVEFYVNGKAVLEKLRTAEDTAQKYQTDYNNAKTANAAAEAAWNDLHSKKSVVDDQLETERASNQRLAKENEELRQELAALKAEKTGPNLPDLSKTGMIDVAVQTDEPKANGSTTPENGHSEPSKPSPPPAPQPAPTSAPPVLPPHGNGDVAGLPDIFNFDFLGYGLPTLPEQPPAVPAAPVVAPLPPIFSATTIQDAIMQTDDASMSDVPAFENDDQPREPGVLPPPPAPSAPAPASPVLSMPNQGTATRATDDLDDMDGFVWEPVDLTTSPNIMTGAGAHIGCGSTTTLFDNQANGSSGPLAHGPVAPQASTPFVLPELGLLTANGGAPSSSGVSISTKPSNGSENPSSDFLAKTLQKIKRSNEISDRLRQLEKQRAEDKSELQANERDLDVADEEDQYEIRTLERCIKTLQQKVNDADKEVACLEAEERALKGQADKVDCDSDEGYLSDGIEDADADARPLPPEDDRRIRPILPVRKRKAIAHDPATSTITAPQALPESQSEKKQRLEDELEILIKQLGDSSLVKQLLEGSYDECPADDMNELARLETELDDLETKINKLNTKIKTTKKQLEELDKVMSEEA